MNAIAQFALYLSFLHLLRIHAAAESLPPYTATDYFLLDCGSSSDSTSIDGRHWEGDSHSKFSPPDIQTATNASTASVQNSTVTQVPYMTARIFHDKFSYSFPVSGGLKFLRLYFYPATYSGIHKSKYLYTVTANNFTLLSNFSAFHRAESFNKEFVIPVLHSQCLYITFIPSPRSYAFINGIEVVSMPNNLYMANKETDGITFVDSNIRFYFDATTALETMYRLNVGGREVSGVDDTGMFRTWRQDLEYMFGQNNGVTPYGPSNVTIKYTADTPAYTVPDIVYETSRAVGTNPRKNMNFNIAWNFPIDVGFNYLFRLHFCEIQPEIVEPNQRVFSIFINNLTAETEADVIRWSGGNGIPVYKEYVVLVPDRSRGKQEYLWLALHPRIEANSKYLDAILNGVEIFKLNRSDGSLAGLHQEAVVVSTGPEPNNKLTERKNSLSLVAIIIGGLLGGIIAISMICFFFLRRSTRVKDSGSGTSDPRSGWVSFPKTLSSTNIYASSLPSDHCRYFLLLDIRQATRNFDRNLVVGSGGFGKVYKGYIDGGSTTVAIKRLNPSSKQGIREFWTEIDLLSKLRHDHLVPLIGYCVDQGEMILVYEFMARGTLRDHLYKTKNPSLSWKRRLQISIGAARGLHYLHSGAKWTIIHRDVKSTNILLDEKWVAKVSDFGLSRTGPTNMSQTHVSTVVKGSFGYVDPEYFRRQQLTVKSDVYSFGVVLLEILCGRPALVPGLPKDQVSLAEWGRKVNQSGTLGDIVDPHLSDQIQPACLQKFGEIAFSCLRGEGIERPQMSDVLWGLESVLRPQNIADDELNGTSTFSLAQIQVDAGRARASPSYPCGDISTADEDNLFSGSGANVSDIAASENMSSAI
ncbi:Receptor-like protein kinase FERONIA [Morella rubra]|uniref:Receptor-like protein kinase FERONIA n=1 Tax=Morella rubra TaxID=262757 RepID=A0A6A1VHZ9_9ROSI|nr:Receptor-like protein kinase FERONIA [Morella rubra]